MRSSTLTWLVSLTLLAGGGAGAAAYRFWPRTPVAQGVKIGERRVPDGAAAVAAWLDARQDAARARKVRFRFEDQFFDATLEAAGVTIDIEKTLEGAKEIAHRGSVWRRLREAEAARRGELDLPLVWTIDQEKARALIATYAAAVAKAPVDARIDLTLHERFAEQPGRALDVEGSLAELEKATHEDEEVVDLVQRRVGAKVTLTDLTRVNIEKVVSAYETTFSLYGTGAGRAINIKNAAARIDGMVLSQGQVFSFNDTVGPRTRERGFALAPEIQGDELQLGYGGGTCQASSTLHAAALFGALDILDRQAHSRPSNYTQMGLDATVSYPLTDLKIRNTLPFPILIHAFSPTPTSIRVEILGGDPVAKVDYFYGVGNTEDFVRRVQVKTNLARGQHLRHQKGIRGFEITSVVRVHYFDGREDERHFFSGYRPTPEIYWVAPGYDVGELPPLPEHAKGVEAAAGGDGIGG